MAGKKSSDIRQTLGSRIGRTARHWRRVVDERLRPFHLTEATWLPLLSISRGKAPMQQKDLAEAVGIDTSTLVRLIDVLDGDGLIQRHTGEDRRSKLLSLTPRGCDLVRKVEATLSSIRRKVLAGIGEEELATASAVIERIHAALLQLSKDT